jgi:hypothetical protein
MDLDGQSGHPAAGSFACAEPRRIMSAVNQSLAAGVLKNQAFRFIFKVAQNNHIGQFER